jgi:hypothetical protein
MQSALRIETQVLPGNKIEINLPNDTALKALTRRMSISIN